MDGAAQTVGDRRGWPADWLNDGVRTYLSPLVEEHEAHNLYATYPSEATPGLRVYVPTAEYMLAMKLMAMRIDATGGKDVEDLINLMQVVDVRTRDEIVAFAARFYPEARISGKLRLSLEHLWQHYQARLARPDNEPPRYLGGSHAADEG